MQELQEIRTLAHEFAQAELRPHVERWDHERTIDAAVREQIAELGFFGMIVPENFGGMGFDAAAYVAVLEQLAWGEPGVAWLVAQSALAASAIQQHGTDAQKQEWLEPVARGEVLPCLALAEQKAGSDLSAVETRARQDGSDWLLDGRKAWVTNPSQAQLALVLARVDGKPEIFLVPRSDSWKVGAREATLGLRPLELGELALQGARVPADARWPDSSLARQPSAPGGELGRLSIAAIAVGLAQSALDHASAYANEREQFGTRLRSFEGIQFKLADMAIHTEAARALLQQAARENEPRLTAMAKVLASESAMFVTTQAVQIFGGYGYMRDYPVEKLMRDAKAMELLEGANELQRVFIAESLYK
ncbi:MAG: acyl-CoA dehydrogenase family protein [Longimicrobiales bacterium]